MTDFTDDFRIADSRGRRASGRGEYRVYFALIFLAALPFACLSWSIGLLHRMRLPDEGPIRLALIQANIITPIVCSA